MNAMDTLRKKLMANGSLRGKDRNDIIRLAGQLAEQSFEDGRTFEKERHASSVMNREFAGKQK